MDFRADITSETPDERDLSRLIESFTVATGLGARFVTPADEDEGSFCLTDAQDCARCRTCILDAGRQSLRFGEPYIAECHAGRFVITAPVMQDGEFVGAVECGPVSIDGENAAGDAQSLSGRGVRAAADLLFLMVGHVARSSWVILKQRKEMADQQALLGELVQAHKQNDAAVVYPIEMERALIAKMRLSDRSGARSILNQLLGRIFYATGDIDVLKARVLELAVILSRSAAEQGDAQHLLGLNQRFIRELSEIHSYEEVCSWVVVVLDSYLDAIDLQRIGRSTSVLDEALAFIRGEYAGPLTLESVAKHVHISPFYLAHLMRQNLGYTFTEYLTRVRVEEARVLLSNTHRPVGDIAAAVGYADAGYFARVFQKAVGMTPRTFRKSVLVT